MIKASASRFGNLLRPAIRKIALLVVCSAGLVTGGCSNSVLLDERFNDTRLINWTVVDDPDTLEGPSDWRVGPDGWVHQQGNIWGRRGDFLGRWLGTCLIAGDAGWKNYTLSARAKSTDDDGFGLIFRYQDSEHFYRLLFLQDGLSGGPVTRLDRREGSDYTELWSVGRGYRPNIEQTIEVRVNDDSIRGLVDGRQLFEVRDGSYRSGRIGLFCYAQSGQAFDDVRVVSN